MTELDWAKSIVGKADFPVVLELGAHHGNDTVEIYDACGKEPLYVAVEADPRNVPLLVNRLETRRVFCVHAAIAAECGVATLYLSSGHEGSGSSSIRMPKAHLEHFPGIMFVSRVHVPALTLDALAERYGATTGADLIWCDIQGAERDMILGGAQTLRKSQYLLCECDRIEMYEGQALRDELLEMLPDWELIDEWPDNANLLLRNRCA
jgi:FkbM family methyltransferase